MIVIEELEGVVAPSTFAEYAVAFLTGVALGMALCGGA
jgi:hypothetical protein